MGHDYNLIKHEYEISRVDSTALFQTILSVASEIGLDAALSYLEKCVTEKRLSWLSIHLKQQKFTGKPILDGYHVFYEAYLGVSTPEDGEIIEQNERRIVMRWWNPCPTLAACQKLGLDTREVCRKAYHRPVQVFLSGFDPRLRFDRNYASLRPYCPYCEEIITLQE